MELDQRHIEIIRQHKRWCGRYAAYSVVTVLLLFAVISWALDLVAVDVVERPEIFIAFATLFLVIVMWNAVGLAIARIHALMEHLPLE